MRSSRRRLRLAARMTAGEKRGHGEKGQERSYVVTSGTATLRATQVTPRLYPRPLFSLLHNASRVRERTRASLNAASREREAAQPLANSHTRLVLSLALAFYLLTRALLDTRRKPLATGTASGQRQAGHKGREGDATAEVNATSRTVRETRQRRGPATAPACVSSELATLRAPLR